MQNHACTIVSAGALHPAELTLEEVLGRALFHGTGEPIQGPLRAGGYDGVFWTARHPAIAQCYIPKSGLAILYVPPSAYALDEGANPNGEVDIAVARAMGLELVAYERDASGSVRSWSWKNAATGEPAWLRKSEVDDYVRNVLGYEIGPGGYCKISERFEDGVTHLMPAAWQKPGELHIVLPQEDIVCFDMTDSGGDLLDPDYHKVGTFRLLEAEGYDGVVINDYVKSEGMGSFGHESIGLFPKGLAKVTTVAVPATHDDLSIYPLPDVTEDLRSGHARLVAERSRRRTVRR